MVAVTAQDYHGQQSHDLHHDVSTFLQLSLDTQIYFLQDHAAYKFEYGVHDPHTHDVHAQEEHRDGKNVVGEYTLHEPDGTQRIVKYVSDHHNGFEAIVERKGHAQHPAHYGKHGEKGGEGGTSYVGITHWSNQGSEHSH